MVGTVNDANVLLVFWFTLGLLTFVFVYSDKFMSWNGLAGISCCAKEFV